jgi:tetratricopeptide (TPR) repeat protein
MNNRKELLKELREVVTTREHGQTDISGKKFDDIIKEAEDLKRTNDREDWQVYIQIIGEYVIQLRHEGNRSYMKALSVAQNLYSFNKSKDLKNPRAIRSVSNTLMNLEAYEVASDYLKELIETIPKEDSAQLGDAMAHFARCNFRMGKVEEAEKILNEALENLDKNSGGSSPLEIAAWKSHALVVKAIILNSRGETKEALSDAEKALKMAKKENVIPRIKEITEVINYLESRIS